MRRSPLDLEALRAAFADRRTHLAIALVEKVETLLDRSGARAGLLVYPEKYQVVAKIPNVAQMPQPNDLVLVGFVNEDEAYIIHRLTSKEDKLEPQAKSGSLVNAAIEGMKAYLLSDTKILLQKPNTTGTDSATEPLVLGNVLISLLTTLIEKQQEVIDKLVAGPIGMGNLGSPVPTYPQLITDLSLISVDIEAAKQQYLDTAATNIVSQLSFTER